MRVELYQCILSDNFVYKFISVSSIVSMLCAINIDKALFLRFKLYSLKFKF